VVHSFLTFVPEHSRKVWAYAMKSINQVLDMFQQFQTRVEMETGRKLKCIHTDNGGKYLGPFDRYCVEQGIRHEKTIPKTPQENDIAERMNGTIVERIQCML